MQPHRKGVTRREALLLASGAAAAAALPAMVVSDANAAAIPKPNVHISYTLSLRTTLRLLREHNGMAGEYYLATGDCEPLLAVRRIARDRFGFYLGLDAKDERARLLFLEADAFIELLTNEFPQVPWDTGQKERFAKLRSWAQAGGQYRLLLAKKAARKSKASRA